MYATCILQNLILQWSKLFQIHMSKILIMRIIQNKLKYLHVIFYSDSESSSISVPIDSVVCLFLMVRLNFTGDRPFANIFW